MDVEYDLCPTLRAQTHGHLPLIYDARGNGGGDICPTITGDHQNRITDYTAIVVEHTRCPATVSMSRDTEPSKPLAAT